MMFHELKIRTYLRIGLTILWGHHGYSTYLKPYIFTVRRNIHNWRADNQTAVAIYRRCNKIYEMRQMTGNMALIQRHGRHVNYDMAGKL